MIKADIENDRESTIKAIIPSQSSFKIEFQTKLISFFTPMGVKNDSNTNFYISFPRA